MKELLYGAAYYDEYMPYDRLEKDVAMMKRPESTQSGLQNQRGVHASRRRVSLIFRM